MKMEKPVNAFPAHQDVPCAAHCSHFRCVAPNPTKPEQLAGHHLRNLCSSCSQRPSCDPLEVTYPIWKTSFPCIQQSSCLLDAGPGSVPGVTGIHEGTAGSHTLSGLGMSGGKRTRGAVWDPSGKPASPT